MTRNRIIVVTGVSRGIGRAMADGFAAAGHTVCGCARSVDSIEELSQHYEAPHRFDTVDVTDRVAVDRWSTEVVSTVGVPDLVVNNAGVVNHVAPLWEVPADEFENVIAVNVIGSVNVLRSFLPSMAATGRGVIVNMSSGWGRSTSPGVAPYCASKYAVEGFTGALAAELPDGLAAVALSPGVIDTDMLRTCWGDEAGDHPSPGEWAKEAVPFLLSLDARHNGRSMRIG